MMKNLVRWAVAGGVTCMLLAGCTAPAARGPRPVPGQSGQDMAAVVTSARAYLSDLARRRQFAGAVLVAEHGRVLLRAGYGWADAARRVPDTTGTRFRIASLTKQFTAMAILRLRDEGRLNVTDRLCRFLASCPPAWRQVTLAELLTHSSGIPDYETLPGFGQLSRQHVAPARLAALVAAKPLLFPPGSRWSYSNTGYVLLGMVIERVSGQSYASFLGQHVLAPLGMRNTGYDTSRTSVPGHATGYADAYQAAPYIDMSVPYAAGALYSTVGDLARWDDALLTGSPGIVRPGTLREMFHPWVAVSPGYPDEGSYGYGWFIDLRGAEYDHDGEISGFVSGNAIFPRADTEIIVLSNLESTDIRTITDRLAALAGLSAR